MRLLATALYGLIIWLLFRLNKETDVQMSNASWIPTTWVFFGATRNPSEWLHLSSGGTSAPYAEGDLINQVVISTLLVLGCAVLLGRTRRVGQLLRTGFPVVLFFLYCGVSVLWSDFPSVAFRRWTRAVGDVIMVLVVLSDPQWIVAVRRIFTRVAFVTLPVSILFIRYYPEYGRAYSPGGELSWTGVATGKNGLGMICLVFGLASLFRFLQVYGDKQGARRSKQLFAHGVAIIMAVYLLIEAHSATSLACSILAAGPMVLAQRFRWARKPVYVTVVVFALLGLASATLLLNVNGWMLQQLGRDSTLTGRTDIWRWALGLVTNPIVGTGYESFWLGPRLSEMWRLQGQTITQVHNGYIEIYLNLGWVGIGLLITILIVAYRRVIRSLRQSIPIASMELGYFIAVLTYNYSEAAFKLMHPLWFALLLIAMVEPDAAVREQTVPLTTRCDGVSVTRRPCGRSLEPSQHQPRQLLPDLDDGDG